MSKEKKPYQATFYLKGGHRVEIGNIREIEVKSAPDGSFSGYSIEWLDPEKAPALFSFSLPDLVAVVVNEQ